MMHWHKKILLRFMPDDGSGSKKVWRIEDMELVEVGEEQINFLYNGDCYVILYTYNGSENIVYFWQGANCSIDERGASALHAARIDNEELGGGAVQVGQDLIISCQDAAPQVLLYVCPSVIEKFDVGRFNFKVLQRSLKSP